MAKKSGKPISDEERKKRSFKHLMLYGIKMMVRRDVGGAVLIQHHANHLMTKAIECPEVETILDERSLAEDFIGKTAAEAAEIAISKIKRAIDLTAATGALELESLKEGIKNRQKRTVSELEERGDNLEGTFVEVLCQMAKEPKSDPLLVRLVQEVGRFLGGEGKTTKTFILR